MSTIHTTSTSVGDIPAASTSHAEHILRRCREIAAHTEIPGQITRTFLSRPMHGVHELVKQWMEAAGMDTSVDAIGNLRGVYPAARQPSRRIVLGSHLDTVPNAGAFDGVLGVVLAIAIVESLDTALPFAIEVIGFSEEEGIRFRKPFLGSLAAIGQLAPDTLALTDAQGVSVAGAIRAFGLDPDRISEAKFTSNIAGYLEVHIEQGPVLESLSEAATDRRSILGVVEAIVGQSRLLLNFEGQANHAGTTPMQLRHDALAAAAEWIAEVERLAQQRPALVATVGQLNVNPGAPNVIPGLVSATLDLRHADDSVRQEAVRDSLAAAKAAARKRTVTLTHETILDQAAVQMHPALVGSLENAVSRAGHKPYRMPSGAGHDAMILAPHIPSAMLFVPSPGGLSHHPDESVAAKDVEAALETTLEFLRLLSHDEAFAHA